MKHMYKFFLLSIFALSAVHTSFCATIGSDSAVERFSKQFISGTGNSILGFALMDAGFVLVDSSTTCSFNSAFPVAGDIALNGGSLYLQSDLGLNNVATMTSLGHVHGASRAINFANTMQSLGVVSIDDLFNFHDVKLVFNSDVTIDTSLCFEGDCSINAQGHVLDLSTTGSLIVGVNSSLTIKNAILKNVSDGRIRCLDDTGSVIFDDTDLLLAGNITIANGSFAIQDLVRIIGNATFVYQSSQTSTVQSDSVLYLDHGVTFSYDVATKDNLYFVDSTSRLELYCATLYAVATGLNLTKGTLRVLRDSYLSSEFIYRGEGAGGPINEGFTFGDDTASNDFTCEIASGVTLKLVQGRLNYRNDGATALVMPDGTAKIYIEADTHLNLYKTLDLDNGYLVIGNEAVISCAAGASIVGALQPLGTYYHAGLL